jgi:hypothetical protein
MSEAFSLEELERIHRSQSQWFQHKWLKTTPLIPFHIAETSEIPRDQWRLIPPEWGAKGPTAAIFGDIASTSTQFKPQYRSVGFLQVLRTSLERINVKF